MKLALSSVINVGQKPTVELTVPLDIADIFMSYSYRRYLEKFITFITLSYYTHYYILLFNV